MANPNSASQRSFAAEPYDSVAAVLASKQITAALVCQRVFTKDGAVAEVVDGGGDFTQPATGAEMQAVHNKARYTTAALPALADYHSAFQRQLNEFGCLFAERKTYALSAPLDVPADVEIRGHARWGTVFQFEGTDGLRWSPTSTNTKASDFYVLGDDTEGTYGVDVHNVPRGVQMDNVFVRRFGGATKNGAGVRLRNEGSSFNNWGAQLSGVVCEGNANGFELIGLGSVTLNGCISRLNFADCLKADGGNCLSINGGAYENHTGSLTGVHAMSIKGVRVVDIRAVWSENAINSLLRLEDCESVKAHFLGVNSTSANQRLVDIIGSRGVDLSFMNLRGINAGDVGIYVDAASRNVNVDAIVYQSLVGSTLVQYEDVRSMVNFEGAWAPVVRGIATAGTYELASGTSCRFVKRGNLMTVDAKIVLAASITGGGSGGIEIRGIPAPYRANSGAVGQVSVSGVPFTGTSLQMLPSAGTADSRLSLFAQAEDGSRTAVPISALGADDEIRFTLSYEVAPQV